MTCRLRHGTWGVAFVVVLLLGMPRASAQGGPLASLEGPVLGLTAEALDEALTARAACQALIRLVNESGAHWDLVRESAMTTDQYRDNYNNQLEEWAIHWGNCVGRRKALPEGLPAAVLAWESSLIERLWLGVRATSDAYLEGEQTSTINQRMATYRGAADAWARGSQVSQAFWAGAYLEDRPDLSCVDRSEAAARRAGQEIWMLSSQPIEMQGPEKLSAVEAGIDAADAERKTCSRPGPSERVQLRLQGRLLRAHRRGLEGLQNGNDDAVRSAMEEAQGITSRMARCQKEHGGGGAISQVCSPLPNRVDGGEAPSTGVTGDAGAQGQ